MSYDSTVQDFLHRLVTWGPMTPTWIKDTARELLRPLPAATREAVGPDNGTDTSRRAGLEIVPASGVQRAAVLDAIWRNHPDGLTREQLEAATGLLGSSVRPRVRELVRDGWVTEDETRTAKTSRGRGAHLLILTERGADSYIPPATEDEVTG